MSVTSLDAIVFELASAIDRLVPQLLPYAKKRGGEWVVGSLSGEAGRSLSISAKRGREGVWKDFSGGQGGDALDLVAQVLFGGCKKEALRWSREWLGIGELDSVKRKKLEDRAREASRLADAGKKQQSEKTARHIRELWHGAQPILGTAADTYLCGRGLDLRKMSEIPRALRFHPRVWCSEIQDHMPAMLSCAIDPRLWQMVALHRTYLEVTPYGVRKASLKNAKKVLGSFTGAHIPLQRGASGEPMAKMPAYEWVAVSEGIENGLSVALVQPSWRVVAAVSMANLATIHLPEQTGGVYIIADNDTNQAASDGFTRAIDRLVRRGLAVQVVRPPDCHKDFNDWLQALLKAEHVDAQAALRPARFDQLAGGLS